MNLSKKSTKTVLILPIALSFAFFTSCDNPAATNGEHHHEHLHPVGAALFMNGQKVAEYHDGKVQGEIHIEAGQETSLITIKFIAENGDLFQPHEPDHSLGWKVLNPSIADVEQHPEDGKWRFHVIGKKAGKTGVKFKLMHGDHSDFTTEPIPIHVMK